MDSYTAVLKSNTTILVFARRPAFLICLAGAAGGCRSGALRICPYKNVIVFHLLRITTITSFLFIDPTRP
jgi:hypothetical protein